MNCYFLVERTRKLKQDFKLPNTQTFFLHEQITEGLDDYYKYIRQIYQLRQDEWLAKKEENKLRNRI